MQGITGVGGGVAQGTGPLVLRPVAHSLPAVGHNLLAEMASQLGKLTQLASEVQELKAENQELVSERAGGEGCGLSCRMC